tara:strand:- start:366 stop:629 length:264 start_codon:yes stop_codon:yes gene_type:complete
MKSVGALVSKGWLYNRKEISDSSSEIGIVVSSPVSALGDVEKLKRKGEIWNIEYFERIITNQVLVMWQSGLTKYHPVCNLVEVKEYE